MLTVVLPNYNHAAFIPYSLDSVLSQTRAADELIVIDDASTDNSVVTIEPYLARHPNARLLRNERNCGIVANLNRGLALAQGDIIFFMAADDIIRPTLLETAVALLQAYPSAAFFSALCQIIDTTGQPRGMMASPVPRLTPGYIPPREVAARLLDDDGWFNGNTTVYRRDLLRASGGFSEELGAFADGYIGRVLALKHGVCFSPTILAAWRRMEGGIAWNESSNIEQVRRTIALVEPKIRENALFPPLYAKRWARRYLFGGLRFALVQRRRNARGVFARARATAIELIDTVWFFVTLRPWDTWPVLKRRISYLTKQQPFFYFLSAARPSDDRSA